jgi:hypothetical protein
MSIKMEDTETLMEKMDALTNLIEQMNLSYEIGDRGHFKASYKKAGDLGFDIMRLLEASDEDSGCCKD